MTAAPRRLRFWKMSFLLGLALALSSGMTLDSPAAGPIQQSGFRVYRERNARGEEVLTITNLDESGRRIGGEVESTVMAGTVATQCAHIEEVSADPPVIVNIYNVTPSQATIDGYGLTEPWQNNPGYGRFSTAYWPSAGRTARSAGQPTGLFGRPPVIDTRPYTRGTASHRNRVYFHRD